MRVPEAVPAVASVAVSGVFRMGSVQAGQAPSENEAGSPANPPGRPAAPESLRLAPIASLDDLKPVARKQAQTWDDEDSIEYEMEEPIASRAATPPRPLRPARGRRFWGPGGIGETVLLGLRRLSDVAYLGSVGFLLLILVAIVLKQHELAITAAVAVVLINIVRLGMDGFVLAALAFKNGLLHGVLFFIPPFTFYYLSKRKVLQDAARRFLGPALPIIAVVLLFVFVPWLRDGEEDAEASPDIAAPSAEGSRNP